MLDLDDTLSVFGWASQVDINSIDNANKPAEMSRDEFANVIHTIKSINSQLQDVLSQLKKMSDSFQ